LKILFEINCTFYMRTFVFIYTLKNSVKENYINSIYCKNATYILKQRELNNIQWTLTYNVKRMVSSFCVQIMGHFCSTLHQCFYNNISHHNDFLKRNYFVELLKCILSGWNVNLTCLHYLFIFFYFFFIEKINLIYQNLYLIESNLRPWTKHIPRSKANTIK